MVSVPLRGCLFEIRSYLQSIYEKCKVSVPLRGCLFEIRCATTEESVRKMFPSPYGDVCLKYEVLLELPKDGSNVSVPLRGCLFEMKTGRVEGTAAHGFRPLTGMFV